MSEPNRPFDFNVLNRLWDGDAVSFDEFDKLMGDLAAIDGVEVEFVELRTDNTPDA